MKHRMYDQYHPLGTVGIVTAFNFPVAVWAWNAMISSVCGNVNLWKPSSKVPLTAIACQHIIKQVLKENDIPEGVFNLVIGRGSTIGEKMLHDKRVPLISITGSTAVGRRASQIIAGRFGKAILELGGNNGIIITPNADLKLTIPAVVFGAVGTAGQRCTTTRRLIIHESVYEQVKTALVKAYQSLRIGNPLDENNHVGPLIDRQAVEMYTDALKTIKKEGGKVIYGGEVLSGEGYESGCYVFPALVEAENHYPIVQEETFAPILTLLQFTMMWYKDYLPLSSPTTCGKRKNSFLTGVRIAVLPTSISVLPAQKSAARSAEKKKPAAAENPAPMPGKATCAGKPILSILAPNYRWHRELNLTFNFCFSKTDNY
jgi:aldehyde dehydrogenase (NAD+)